MLVPDVERRVRFYRNTTVRSEIPLIAHRITVEIHAIADGKEGIRGGSGRRGVREYPLHAVALKHFGRCVCQFGAFELYGIVHHPERSCPCGDIEPSRRCRSSSDGEHVLVMGADAYGVGSGDPDDDRIGGGYTMTNASCAGGLFRDAHYP